jgi:phosphatidylinositol 3-kinase
LSPVQKLNDEEMNLLFKFRYYLTRHKRALTKFLKSTDWDDPQECQEAMDMLPLWAEIDIDDALELLGPAFTHPKVRSYAVGRLRKASDRELQLYLLQLVEAMKFEPLPEKKSFAGKSSLAWFLMERAASNPMLGNYFYWYVSVEAQERGPTSGGIYAASAVYEPLLSNFEAALRKQPQGDILTDTLNSQKKLMKVLLDLARAIRTSKDARPKKIEQLQAFLREPRHGLLSFPAVSLPLDPTVSVVGCVPDESTVFKSSLFPLKVTLRTDDGGTYPIMLKSGDDLRQDQLVIQTIILMDQLLRNENLDLKLTPYRILATGLKDGVLQFIPNQTLADVLTEYHGIIPYLRSHNADETSKLGIKPEVMDTFVRSCAGYCVITYILGVGDRHLDNLLICEDGHFFHADYGYILGRDPKPFPPMMKLPAQIIDGMGGAPSENYDKFRSYCFTAYTTLRKSANLILNLFALMTESTIPDIMFEKDKAVHKVKEKFCLEMTEEAAILHFQNLINDSVTATLPKFIDALHNLTQKYWRG